MASIRLEHLRKAYGTTPVVRDVSLNIPSGEFLSLLGPSGCGKTTTLRMIAGLESPDAGQIFIGDEEMVGPRAWIPPERRGLGMVFQSYAVWPHKSIARNVAYPLQLQGIRGAELESRVLQALSWVRLDALKDRMPHQLSGGQLQRVALARALVGNPKVLLLDEPLSNLDAALREELRAEIASLRSRLGTTLVYVTHDQGEALALSDRIAVMNGGVVEQVASPSSLYHQPQSAFVAGFVGGANLLKGELKDGAFHSSEARFELPAASLEGTQAGPGILAIRPEDLALGTTGTSLPLAARLFLGNAMEYRFHLGDRLLRAIGTPTEVTLGQAVFVKVSRARFFPS